MGVNVGLFIFGVGEMVYSRVGKGVGKRVGKGVGKRVGKGVGKRVGIGVGKRVGIGVGSGVGKGVGKRVGGLVVVIIGSCGRTRFGSSVLPIYNKLEASNLEKNPGVNSLVIIAPQALILLSIAARCPGEFFQDSTAISGVKKSDNEPPPDL